MPLNSDLGFFLSAAEELHDQAMLRSFKGEATEPWLAPARRDAHRAWPDEFAEVREVIIQAGISDLLGLTVNDHDRMLDVVVGIAVDWGNQPRSTRLVQNHIPID